MRPAVLVSLLLAALSLLVVLPAPSYDAWAWLLWGDQILSGALDTVDGPSFKPLPVTVAALLAPLGGIASVLWVWLARTGAVLAVILAFGAGRRLCGGSRVAGVVAAVGVALCGGYLELAAAGLSEGLLVALALAGAELWRTGRARWALACAVAAALVRVETWPFLLAAGIVFWVRRPQDRRLLVAAAVLVPLAWVVPEVIGSGQALRSASRARVPNPGQPGLSDTPVLASLRAALVLPLWPLWAGVVLAAWPAWSSWRRGERGGGPLLVPAAVGLAWIGLVAAMAGAGFSGEPRYALPGAALIGLSGAGGLVMVGPRLVRAGARRPYGRVRTVGAAMARRSDAALGRSSPARSRGQAAGVVAMLAAVAALAVAAVPRVDSALGLRRSQAYQWRLQDDLAAAVVDVGGPGAILACGQPFVGPLRGPLLAHHLEVAKRLVEPDDAPQAPGMVFRSALHLGELPAPVVPAGFALRAAVGPWQVYADCARPGLGPSRVP